MRVLSKQEFEAAKDDIYEQIINGAIFIYPTDTIYGIGCNAKNSNAVRKIRRLKERKESPFSVIAPSKDWIKNNCEVHEKASEWIGKLPGPLTLILKKKGSPVSKEVTCGLLTLGVRMPKHWFTSHVEELDVPIVTTSVNKHGEQYMTSLDNLDDDLKRGVDFIIYDGEIQGKPSKLVDLGDSFKIIER